MLHSVGALEQDLKEFTPLDSLPLALLKQA